jgi:hypothetical protein
MLVDFKDPAKRQFWRRNSLRELASLVWYFDNIPISATNAGTG